MKYNFPNLNYIYSQHMDTVLRYQENCKFTYSVFYVIVPTLKSAKKIINREANNDQHYRYISTIPSLVLTCSRFLLPFLLLISSSASPSSSCWAFFPFLMLPFDLFLTFCCCSFCDFFWNSESESLSITKIFFFSVSVLPFCGVFLVDLVLEALLLEVSTFFCLLSWWFFPSFSCLLQDSPSFVFLLGFTLKKFLRSYKYECDKSCACHIKKKLTIQINRYN